MLVPHFVESFTDQGKSLRKISDVTGICYNKTLNLFSYYLKFRRTACPTCGRKKEDRGLCRDYYHYD